MTDLSGVQPPATPSAPAVSATVDRRGDLIAYAAIGMLFYIVTLIFVAVILKIEVSPVMMTLVSVVVTAVTAGAATVINFQFGSSKGSQAKDAQIAALTPPSSTSA
jgi:hypothetical protein